MTTVIPALSGGMGSARAVSPAGDAAKPSGFSELLAQAATEADTGAERPAGTLAAAAPADGGNDAEPAGAEPSAQADPSTETPSTAPLSKTDADQSQSQPDAGEQLADTGAASPYDAAVPVVVPVVVPGGKALPEAANTLTEPPENEPSLSRQGNPVSGVQEAAGQPTSKPPAAATERGNPIQKPLMSAAQPETPPAADGKASSGEGKAVAGGVAQESPATYTAGRGRTEPSSSANQAEAPPVPGKPDAGKPESDKLESNNAGRAAGISLSTLTLSPVSGTERAPVTPQVSEKVAGLPTGEQTLPAAGGEEAIDGKPAGKRPADSINPRQTGASFQGAVVESSSVRSVSSAPVPDDLSAAESSSVRSVSSAPVPDDLSAAESPSVRSVSSAPVPDDLSAAESSSVRSVPSAPVPDDLSAAEGDVQAEQAAQPRQDAAITRQDSQRQPATPEWLAQIEHGRLWQQAQQSGMATEQAVVSNTDSPDTDLPVMDNAAEAKDESAEPEDNASRTDRLSDAMTLAQGSVTRDASGQPPVAQDGQQPLTAVTAGREAGATAAERALQPQGERLLNLYQGTPEQNARQLSQQVQVMVNQELQEADIRLNPSELGGMRIQLKFEQGEVSLQIQAQHTQARDMLEQAMPRLRDLLSQQGIQLGQGQVGGFASQQGSAQNGASGQGATGRENGHNSAPFEPDAGEGEPAHGSYGTGAFASNGRIDFFA